LGDRISHSIGVTKQWALQKIGSVEPSQEPQNFKDLMARHSIIKQELNEVLESTSALLKSRLSIVDDYLHFNNSIAKLGSHSKVNLLSSETVRGFTASSVKIQSYQRDLDKAFRDLIQIPIKNLLMNEIKQVSKLRKEYDNLHLEYDARMIKFKSLSERSDVAETPKRIEQRREAKADLDIATNKYELLKEQLTNLYLTIENKRNLLLSENLSLYMKSQLVYCANSLSTLEQHTYEADKNPFIEKREIKEKSDEKEKQEEEKHEEERSENARDISVSQTISDSEKDVESISNM